MNYEIIFSDLAQQDLLNIYNYIAYHLLEPQTAQNLFNRFDKAISSLDFLPERFHFYRDKPFRVLRVDNYCVFFKIDEDTHSVHISTIRYGGQDLDNISF